jgi:hypothetical protein
MIHNLPQVARATAFVAGAQVLRSRSRPPLIVRDEFCNKKIFEIVRESKIMPKICQNLANRLPARAAIICALAIGDYEYGKKHDIEYC